MNIKIDISNVTLKTNRLIIRPFRLSDLDDFFEYASVDGVGEMAGWKHHQTKEETLKILNMFIEDKKTFAIECNNKVIGSIGIEEYNEKLFYDLIDLKGRELGFVLSKKYWGQGIMAEACKEVLNYLFDTLKLDFVICGHYTWNIQSKKVQEKLGFKEIKRTLVKTRMETIEDTIYSIIKRG